MADRVLNYPEDITEEQLIELANRATSITYIPEGGLKNDPYNFTFTINPGWSNGTK